MSAGDRESCSSTPPGALRISEAAESATVVYRSVRRADCDERVFVLGAVGLNGVVAHDGGWYTVCVDAADAGVARMQLLTYEAESQAAQRATPAADAELPAHRGAWIGGTAYVLVLLAVAYAVASGLWPYEAFERGVLNAAAVQRGEWWRAWTALTLHWDVAHLVANLGGGVWFGVLAARQLGAGTAWLLTVTGAALANLFDAGLGPADYLSAGASTAVFAALGLLSAHAWRSRFHLSQRRVLRWAPLVGGVILLGWFGSAGEGTDLVAHALGFTIGAAFGALAALRAVAATLSRVPQWLSGLLAVASIALAWTRAIAP